MLIFKDTPQKPSWFHRIGQFENEKMGKCENGKIGKPGRFKHS
jgi:hypothetical protein